MKLQDIEAAAQLKREREAKQLQIHMLQEGIEEIDQQLASLGVRFSEFQHAAE